MATKINVKMTNRWLYTLVSLSMIILLTLGVYAYGTSNPQFFGHSTGEVDFSIPIEQDVTFNGDVYVNGKLITTQPVDSDPDGTVATIKYVKEKILEIEIEDPELENVFYFGHVGAILKDGAYVNTAEIGVNVGCTVKYEGDARVDDGEIETRVRMSSCDCGASACNSFTCDTGWVTGNAKCDKVFANQNRIVATIVPNEDGARFYVTDYTWNTISGWVVSEQPSLDNEWI